MTHSTQPASRSVGDAAHSSTCSDGANARCPSLLQGQFAIGGRQGGEVCSGLGGAAGELQADSSAPAETVAVAGDL